MRLRHRFSRKGCSCLSILIMQCFTEHWQCSAYSATVYAQTSASTVVERTKIMQQSSSCQATRACWMPGCQQELMLCHVLSPERSCEHHEWPRINSSCECSNTQNNTYMLSALTAALWSGLTLKIVPYFLWHCIAFFPLLQFLAVLPQWTTSWARSPRKWLRAYQSGPRLRDESTTVPSTSGREKKKKKNREEKRQSGSPRSTTLWKTQNVPAARHALLLLRVVLLASG